MAMAARHMHIAVGDLLGDGGQLSQVLLDECAAIPGARAVLERPFNRCTHDAITRSRLRYPARRAASAASSMIGAHARSALAASGSLGSVYWARFLQIRAWRFKSSATWSIC